MAKLARLPAQSIIDGFRGVLDFYEDTGLFVVRKWPSNKRSGNEGNAPLYQPNFARINRLKRFVTAPMQVAYDRYTQGGTNTWADQTITTYYGRNRPNDEPLPPAP